MTRRHAAILAALGVLAAACAPLPQIIFPQLRAAPTSFEVSGRLAVRTHERSDIARLRWVRRGGADLWVIASPFGNEVARIESNPRGAVLTQAGAAPETAASFPALTEKLLGVSLDPALLAGWLHGQSPAGAPGEWKVSIDETRRAGDIDLAWRITASRGDVVVKLVVDEYKAPSE
jgi:outer membrane biogenesis lipoprotein LolB